MKTVMYRARDPQGTEVFSKMDAESLASARAALEQRGLTQIVFITDPILDPEGAGGGEIVPPGTPLAVVVGLPLAVLTAIATGVVLGPLGGEALLYRALAVVAIALVAVVFVLPAAVYPALRRDRAWGRWQAMRTKARFLKACNLAIRNRTLRMAFDFEEARALAGLGRLDDALQMVEPHAGTSVAERANHLGQLVGVYEIAGRYDAALRLAEEHVSICPDSAVASINLAMRHVLRFRDAVRAREALARVGTVELSAMADGFRAIVLGMIQLEEGAPTDALVSLGRADRVLREHAPSSADELKALIGVHRAWALGALGRTAEAQAELGVHRAELTAGGERALVSRASAAIEEGRTAGG